MSEPRPEGLNPHEIARAEIDSWRGRSLDLFARAERSIGIALEATSTSGRIIKLRHLAGQRLEDLVQLVTAEQATTKQAEALVKAISKWREVEVHRAFLAHGIARELLDRHGAWHVQFDLTAYKTNVPTLERMVLSRSEALEFEKNLEESFKALSAN